MNIIIVARNRHRLTEQALRSVLAHTANVEFTLTVIDDDSEPPIEIQDKWWRGSHWCQGVSVEAYRDAQHNLGALKNAGVTSSRDLFGTRSDELLCILDNDICVFPGWAEKLWAALRYGYQFGFRLLGSCRHPYHEVNRMLGDGKGVEIFGTDAVAGYCHFLRWRDWKAFGPYPETGGAGAGQSEDHALCRRIVEAGFEVGYVDLPVLAHCGVTNTNGQPAIGAERFPRVEGVLYE